MSTLVYSTVAYDALRDELCRLRNLEAGQVKRQVFPDGEHYQRLLTDPSARDVAVLGGTLSDADTLELYDLACGAVDCGARSLTLVIPYFGYSTMERAERRGEVVTAKTRARLLSSIPVPGAGSRVLLLDLHSEGIPYYFEGGVRPRHLYAKRVVLDIARRLGGADFVIACTDAGRAKWVESLANDLGVSASFVFKRRLDGERTQITAVSAAVQGKRVIIYDDMIRTGSSLINAARAYADAGATSIAAVTTHGIFPGDALQRIRETGLFERIVCTDSHPRALALRCDFLQVESVAGVLAEHL
ncbi:MAG: ribose-phosphate diphosphokinase [Myxococcaceae bacterium]